jgi:hypothetical protein
MKSLFLTLILTLVFGGFSVAQAQKDQMVKIRVGQQKSVPQNGLTIKFLSLVEDSRCPTDTDCIWAGNAKIKVQISNRRGGSQTFEMNTNLGPKGDSFGGYAIYLESLAPAPRSNIRINRNGYTATFKISKLTR